MMIVLESRAIYWLSRHCVYMSNRRIGCFRNLGNQILHLRVERIYFVVKLLNFFSQSCDSRNQETDLLVLPKRSVGCSHLTMALLTVFIEQVHFFLKVNVKSSFSNNILS